MRSESSVASRQSLAGFVAALVLLLGAQGAWATPPQGPLGGNNPIVASAYTKHNNGQHFTPQEAEYWKDKTEYESISAKLWPICTDADSDVAQNCKNLSAEQLKASYPDTSIGGLGARYSVSKEQAEVLRQRKTELERKWADKP